MPGHIKKADPNEKDPDPLPYLVVTLEMKRADAQIPYDPKKSFYCPDGKHGFMECVLESLEGDKATVMCGHEVINEGNLIIIKRITEKIASGHTWNEGQSKVVTDDVNFHFNCRQSRVCRWRRSARG